MNPVSPRRLAAISALGLFLAAAAPARGDIVSVVADDVDWDTVASPGMSPDMTFKLFNVASTGDLMTGWQLRLRIVADAGATGSIHFNNAFEPANNYIFDGRTDGLVATIDPGDDTMLFAFDSDNMFVGVAPDTDKTLLSANFFTNDMAMGSWSIQALGNLGDTQWSAAADPTDREFANVPFDNTWVTIAHVRSVPEPGSLALLALSAPVLWLARSLRARREAGQNARVG